MAMPAHASESVFYLKSSHSHGLMCLQCKLMSLILIAWCFCVSVDLHQGFTITMQWQRASGGEVMLLPAEVFG